MPLSPPLVKARFAGEESGIDGASAVPEGRVVFVSSVVAGPARADAPAESLVDEARHVFSVLRRRLAHAGVTFADVCFVQLCEEARLRMRLAIHLLTAAPLAFSRPQT